MNLQGLRWHHHLSGVAALACLFTFNLGAAAGGVAVHVMERGGYQPAPLPPPIALGGGAFPDSVSLGKYVVRVHNQGAGNSCVGQTLATIVEILHAERTNSRIPFSSGFIWNQLNGGKDAPITYDAAFNLLTLQGDAPLADFAPDGASRKFEQPDPIARRQALAHRAVSWNSIDPHDTTTMRSMLATGHPLAVAIPITTSTYNLWNLPARPIIDQQTGSFLFWHSVTAIGYTPRGLIILNSWGKRWGWQGRAILTWNLVATAGAGVVVAHFGPWMPSPHPVALPSAMVPAPGIRVPTPIPPLPGTEWAWLRCVLPHSLYVHLRR